MKNRYFLLGALLVFTISCHKYHVERSELEDINNNVFAGSNPFEKVGIIHNEIVEAEIEKLNRSSSDNNAIKLLDRIFRKQYSYNIEYLQENLGGGPNTLLDRLKEDRHINEKLHYLVSKDLKYIELLSLSEIKDYVSSRLAMTVNLTDIEKEKYWSFLAVLEYSATLWLSQEKGGMDFIKVFKPNWGSPRYARGNCFDEAKALASDAVGALIGGPTGAGAATLISIINQWDCDEDPPSGGNEQ